MKGQLIVGSAFGLAAGAQTHSPLFYAHLDMKPGALAEILGGHKERALYIASGAVEMDGARYEAGRMLVLGAAFKICPKAQSQWTELWNLLYRPHLRGI